MTEEGIGRYHRNSPGPFYVEAGACISCGAPENEAPDLICFDDKESHCYFAKQPASPAETSRAIRSLWVSCCGALRYSGTDPALLARLSDIGLADRCDNPVATRRTLLVRNHASFSFRCDGPRRRSCGREIAQSIIAGLVKAVPGIKVNRLIAFLSRTRIAYTWHKGIPGVEVSISRVNPQERIWLLRVKGRLPAAEISNAMLVDDILRGDRRFAHIRWYTEQDWHSARGRSGELPY